MRGRAVREVDRPHRPPAARALAHRDPPRRRPRGRDRRSTPLMNGSAKNAGIGALTSLWPSAPESNANSPIARLRLRARRRVEHVGAVDREHVVLGALVAPELLVAGDDHDRVALALRGQRVQARVRLRGQQAHEVVVAPEGLVVEVVRPALGPRDRELVVGAALELERAPRAVARELLGRRGPADVAAGRRLDLPHPERRVRRAGVLREEHGPAGDLTNLPRFGTILVVSGRRPRKKR